MPNPSKLFFAVLLCAVLPMLALGQTHEIDKKQVLPTRPIDPPHSVLLSIGAAQKTMTTIQKKQSWRIQLLKTQIPNGGCFTSTYPSTRWQAIPCKTPPARPYGPAFGPKPASVGNGNDFSAQAAGAISLAEGSFDSVTGISSIKGPFSLQLNTQTFTTTACDGAVNKASCFGWQQFVLSSSDGAFIQFWLINFSTTSSPVACPTGFAPFTPTGTTQVDCFRSSDNGVPVPVGNLADLRITGWAFNGQDAMVVVAGNQSFIFTNPDTILNLQTQWSMAEFNIFGDCCDNQVQLSPGSTLVVRTSIDQNSAAAPTCVLQGFTGETNNAAIQGPCAGIPATNGALPAIVFTESVPGGDCSQKKNSCGTGKVCCTCTLTHCTTQTECQRECKL
jgi:hypothetical protein